MQVFFCILIFVMGTVFGSFFTLAVYRIPLNKNILYERSFCPKCHHRLEFLDLIPIISYIFLRGKCRYCGEKVRIRYLILELLSGFVFLIAYLSLQMTFPYLELNKIVYFIAFIMFYITVILISGIDKENLMIDKRLLLFGLIMQTVYEIYLYVFAFNYNLTLNFLIILVLVFLSFLIDTILLKKIGETKYCLQIIMFILYLITFVKLELVWIDIIFSVLLMLIYKGYKVMKFNMVEKPDILQELPSKKIPIGFCIGIASLITILIYNFIIF